MDKAEKNGGLFRREGSGRGQWTLTRKILAVILGTLIPVVALNIGLSLMSVRLLERQVYSAHLYELQRYVSALDTAVQRVEEELNGIIEENWSVFREHYDGEKEIAFSQIQRDYRALWGRSPEVDYLYFRTGQTAEDVIVSYDPERFSYEASTVVKRGLAGAALPEVPSREYRVIVLGGKAYLLYNISNQKRSTFLGFLVGIDTVLAPLEMEELTSQVFLVDGEGRAYGADGAEAEGASFPRDSEGGAEVRA